ncbi:MAG: carbonic anhydrase [Myxococcaceae bacterium]
MQKLVEGVHKFQNEIFGKHRELFERLAEVQNPDTLFITCADSRINPALITQTEPGDIFILRNAGNIVPPAGHRGGEAATIEYAIHVLDVKDIIVCGHSNCGAMKALLGPPLTSLPAVAQWLEYAEITKRIVEEKYPHATSEQKTNIVVQENVLAQIENLRTHPSVAARLARGKLRLHGWVYKIETGEVFGYDPTEAQFRPLIEVGTPLKPEDRDAFIRSA